MTGPSTQTNPTTPNRLIRVFIVEDHPLVREGLRACIEGDAGLSVCGDADDVAPALEAIAREHPDVVIVDLSLKSGSGLDLIKQLTAKGSQVRPIVSSMHDENIYAERAIEAGAKGFVHKEQAATKIVDAIHVVMDGKLFLSSTTRRRISDRATNGRKPDAGPVSQLTNRELQVFEKLGEGLSVREIAEALELSPKTIETYRDRIRNKLGLDSSTRLLRYAVKWVSEHNGH